MDPIELKSIIENLLLASDQPVSPELLRQTFLNGSSKEELLSVLKELQEDYQSKNLQIVEVADGFQLCTRPEYSDWVRKFLKLDRSFKLSRAALDTLAIVAYKQPLTRAEVDEIRGVDSSGAAKENTGRSTPMSCTRLGRSSRYSGVSPSSPTRKILITSTPLSCR